jgi:NAD(P)-dependent dehydrogenase (short-subunit alcohol dehydrogenase family)
LFVENGARVVIGDLQNDRGSALAQELSPHVIFLRTDVAKEDDVRTLVSRAESSFGRLDCVFNNAGFGGALGGIGETPVEEWDLTFDVLVRGVFLGMKHAAPVMKAQGSGSIISTASVAGLRTGFGPHVYSAAKAAVIHLTHSVAMELGESGVRVNCICPGGIATPIFGKAFGAPERADEIAGLMKGVLPMMQPIRRSGLPDDIAQAALWLASDEASFVNGHALVVDGGLTGGRLWSEVRERRAVLRTALGFPPE